MPWLVGYASEIPVLLSSDGGTPQEIAAELVYALRLLSCSTGATHEMEARMACGEAVARTTQDARGTRLRRHRDRAA